MTVVPPWLWEACSCRHCGHAEPTCEDQTWWRCGLGGPDERSVTRAHDWGDVLEECPLLRPAENRREE